MGAAVSDVDRRVLAKIELVLEEACRELVDGGSHAERKSVAELLLKAPRRGQTTLGELGIIARKEVAQIKAGTGSL